MELLAPAGSIAALKAAVMGGANAVYLGLGEHNARLKCSEFNEENLKDWISYAHLFGVKVHVTLNTAVTDFEIDRALELAEISVKSGADALIVSDLGLFAAIRERSDVPLHLSTQAGVQNEFDARFAETLGADRVILARETVEEDIPSIKKEVGEVERFAQGALCVCFSGGCLLGSIDYGQSGNRGVCNQPCRLRYVATDEDGNFLKKGFLLSPFDISLGEDACFQEKLGVDSLKIEGRLKRAAYVYFATKYYRDLLDGKPKAAKEDLVRLKTSFNRGFFKGYTLKKSAAVIHSDVASHIGVFVGKIERIIDKSGYKYAYVKSSRAFMKGDGAKILRNGEEAGGSDVTSVYTDGEYCVIPVSNEVKPGDEVRLTTDAEDVRFAETIENKLPLKLTLKGAPGQKLTLRAESCGFSVEVQSESFLEKSNSDSNEALIEKATKFGSSDFVLESYEDELDGAVYLKVSELNALRRSLAEKLRDTVLRARFPNYSFVKRESIRSVLPNRFGVLAEIERAEDANAFSFAVGFVLDPLIVNVDSIGSIVNAAAQKPCYLRLPKIARSVDLRFYEKILRAFGDLGIYADNLYGVQLARELGRRYIAGFGLNVCNHRTALLFKDADYICSSVEFGGAGNLSFGFGKIPLMSFAHCPISVTKGNDCATCDKKTNHVFYSTGSKRYSIRRTEGGSCSFTMRSDVVARRIKEKTAAAFVSLIDLDDGQKIEAKRIASEESWIKA